MGSRRDDEIVRSSRPTALAIGFEQPFVARSDLLRRDARPRSSSTFAGGSRASRGS